MPPIPKKLRIQEYKFYWTFENIFLTYLPYSLRYVISEKKILIDMSARVLKMTYSYAKEPRFVKHRKTTLSVLRCFTWNVLTFRLVFIYSIVTKSTEVFKNSF